MKSTKTTPTNQLILTALLVGFGMVFTPVVLAQPMSNYQEQNCQDYHNQQSHEGHEGHENHEGHRGH